MKTSIPEEFFIGVVKWVLQLSSPFPSSSHFQLTKSFQCSSKSLPFHIRQQLSCPQSPLHILSPLLQTPFHTDLCDFPFIHFGKTSQPGWVSPGCQSPCRRAAVSCVSQGCVSGTLLEQITARRAVGGNKQWGLCGNFLPF